MPRAHSSWQGRKMRIGWQGQAPLKRWLQLASWQHSSECSNRDGQPRGSPVAHRFSVVERCAALQSIVHLYSFGGTMRTLTDSPLLRRQQLAVAPCHVLWFPFQSSTCDRRRCLQGHDASLHKCHIAGPPHVMHTIYCSWLVERKEFAPQAKYEEQKRARRQTGNSRILELPRAHKGEAPEYALMEWQPEWPAW